MTVQEFLQGLKDVIKKGMKAIAKAIAKHGIFSLAVPVAIVALFTAVALYRQQYEPLVVPDEPPTQQSASAPSSPPPPPPPPPPRITTAITKDQDEWMSKYCKEQAATLPLAPFKYQNRKNYEQNKGVPIPPLYVGKRMPNKANGYPVDSLTCGFSYKYDDKEAFASVGVIYKFDIDRFNDFYERSDSIYTNNMDATWKKVSPLSNEEAYRSPSTYKGYPLLFMRENLELGTVEYASINFAVDYYVHFTVYEKPK